MTRTVLVSIVLGLALASAGCAPPHRHDRAYGYGYDRDDYDYDRRARRDRDERIDINRASQRELQRLPGISDDDANRIVANRPYPDKEALVRRGVIGPRQYDRIESYVYAGDARRRRDRDDDRRGWDDDDRRHRRYYDSDR